MNKAKRLLTSFFLITALSFSVASPICASGFGTALLHAARYYFWGTSEVEKSTQNNVYIVNKPIEEKEQDNITIIPKKTTTKNHTIATKVNTSTGKIADKFNKTTNGTKSIKEKVTNETVIKKSNNEKTVQRIESITVHVHDLSSAVVAQHGNTCGPHSVKNNKAILEYLKKRNAPNAKVNLAKALAQHPVYAQESLGAEELQNLMKIEGIADKSICIGNLSENFAHAIDGKLKKEKKETTIIDFFTQEQRKPLFELIDALKNKKQITRAFSLGNMVHNKNGSTTYGHWVGVVVSITTKGNVHYFYTNSIKGCSDYRDKTILELNNFLSQIALENGFGKLKLTVKQITLPKKAKPSVQKKSKGFKETVSAKASVDATLYGTSLEEQKKIMAQYNKQKDRVDTKKDEQLARELAAQELALQKALKQQEEKDAAYARSLAGQ